MDFFTTEMAEINEKALDAMALRNKLIASNISNINSPGYKRVDLEFENQLSQIINSQKSKKPGASLKFQPDTLLPSNTLKNPRHISINAYKTTYEEFKPDIKTNDEVSLHTNGNNVSIEYEMAELAKNGTKYTIVATLQEKTFRGLQEVIKGGASA